MTGQAVAGSALQSGSSSCSPGNGACEPGGEGRRAPLLVIAGPTASGKSALALAVARAFDGVVINADSMQVYRELRILTARPGPDELAAVPHRLYGCLPGNPPCSAGRWRALALAEIAAARQSGRLPIVVGGTGLYLRALMRGLAPVPPIPAAVRAAARRRFDELGAPAFHAALAARDPVMAARLHPNDRQRLLRAWEVLEATGRSLSFWQRGDEPAARRSGASGTAEIGPSLTLVLMPPRDALYRACDARFAAMIREGGLDEVRRLLALDLDPELPVMKSLGVPELRRHLAGELTLEQAVAAGQQATRRYAKRQVTWLRGQLLGNDPCASVFPEQYSESLLPSISNNIREFLLTPSA